MMCSCDALGVALPIQDEGLHSTGILFKLGIYYMNTFSCYLYPSLFDVSHPPPAWLLCMCCCAGMHSNTSDLDCTSLTTYVTVHV